MATPDFIKAPVALINNLLLPHPGAPQCDLKGKTMLVTGASPGSIGYESALTFFRWGAKVVVTVRSESSQKALLAQLEKDDIHGIDVFLLDLESVDSVNKFVNDFLQSHHALDVLLNNAGVYFDMLGKWKEERLTDDSEEIHWRINYLGVVQLTNALFPLLKKSALEKGEARVVLVSSHMHDNCQNEEMFSGLNPYKSVKAYGRSKLGLMHFSNLMHDKLYETSRVKFISLHPGSIQTNLVEKGLSDSPLLIKLRKAFLWLEKLILLSPVEGAQTQIFCCTAEEVESGHYYRRCKQDKHSPQLNDEKVSQALWEQTQNWLLTYKQSIHL